MSRIDIKSEREFLREVYDKLDKGIYGIPVFQRDFVWAKDKIVDFFDSIWRGYPVGSILLWKPDISIASKDIITDKVLVKKNPSYFVLDGRQRLSSFFGCVKPNSNPKFKLFFNLETEQFGYKEGKYPLIRVSDVYNTFTLLNKLQEILDFYKKNPTKGMELANKAKLLNSILQGYTMSEVYISNCSLKEAEIVFARVNSRGTDITHTFMLQATSFEQNGRLLTDIMDEIRGDITSYGFGTMSNEDLLNCFYKFAGKEFYDSKPNDLENMDFSENLNDIRETIIATSKFLHDDCLVIDRKLLPYSKQFIALTWFFQRNKNLSVYNRQQLKKWFFYTSYNQNFMNSSLSNVRSLFRQMDDFAKNKKSEPLKYHELRLNRQFNFSFRLNNAKTSFLALAYINLAKSCEHPVTALQFDGTYSIKKGGGPIFNYICVDNTSKYNLNLAFKKGENLPSIELEKYGLRQETLTNFHMGNIAEYTKMRREELYYMEKRLLEENDITLIEGNS